MGTPDAGLYGPGSVTWRLARERVLLLGGPRALLLQLAHPGVAAAVAEHSSFPSGAVRRLRRTLDATLSLAFGSTAQALAAAARVNAVHGRIRGEGYDALDPDLLAWVHATLVDTTLVVYPLLVAPLSRRDMERSWEESKVAARLLLVGEDRLPATLDEFREAFSRTVAALEIGPGQREMARHVLYPVRGVPRAVWRPLAAFTISLLPDAVRDGYGLPAGGSGPLPAVVRAVLPRLPRAVRFVPQARLASARLGAGT